MKRSLPTFYYGENRMRLHHSAIVALLSLLAAATCLAADGTPSKRDDSASEKLGFSCRFSAGRSDN